MLCITSPVQTVQLRRDDRRNGDQQARPSTSFDDNTTDTPRRSFLRPDFATKFQERSGLLGIQTVEDGWKTAVAMPSGSSIRPVSIHCRFVTDRDGHKAIAITALEWRRAVKRRKRKCKLYTIGRIPF